MIGVDRTRLVVYLTAEERDRIVEEAEKHFTDPSTIIRRRLGLTETDWGFRKDDRVREMREIVREVIREVRAGATA